MSTLTTADLKHHALVVQTNEPHAALSLLESLLGVSFSHAAHPDFIFRSYELLGIEEVRELSFLSLKKPVVDGLLHIVVCAEAVTTQAQNALLKQTEEPSEATKYIFILPTRVPILETLRSRCTFVVLDESTVAAARDDTRTIDQDLRAIVKMTKEKNNAAMETMIRAVETNLHGADKHDVSLANALLLVRTYIETQGASSKMLLEHLALSQREGKLQ